MLTLQNGVESYAEVARQVGHERVLPGAAYIETHIESPGVIKQVGEVVRIVFGETDGRSTPRAERVLETFKGAEIVAEISPDVVKTLWTKFLFISTLAGLTSVARASMSDLLNHQASRAMVLATMQEIEAVGLLNAPRDLVDAGQFAGGFEAELLVVADVVAGHDTVFGAIAFQHQARIGPQLPAILPHVGQRDDALAHDLQRQVVAVADDRAV